MKCPCGKCGFCRQAQKLSAAQHGCMAQDHQAIIVQINHLVKQSHAGFAERLSDRCCLCIALLLFGTITSMPRVQVPAQQLSKLL